MIVLREVAKIKSRKECHKIIKNLVSADNHLKLSRPEHALSVYYLGDSLISRLFGFQLIETNLKKYVSFNVFWLYCSLFHDYGYGPEFQTVEKLSEYNHFSMRNKYIGYLLDSEKNHNKRWLRSFTSHDLEVYYTYWILCGREYCCKNNFSDGYELYEHGILGGWLFSEKFHNKKPSDFLGSVDLWNDVVLAISLMIAQHNIWPIPEEYIEKIIPKDLKDANGAPVFDVKKFNGKKINYSLYIDSLSFSICLIDSIDITKKFYGKRERNGYEYIKNRKLLNEVLSALDFEVTHDEEYSSIVINYKEVKGILVKHHKKTLFDKWVNSIRGMETFLDLETEVFDDRIVIKIKYIPKAPFDGTDAIKIKQVVLDNDSI